MDFIQPYTVAKCIISFPKNHRSMLNMHVRMILLGFMAPETTSSSANNLCTSEQVFLCTTEQVD